MGAADVAKLAGESEQDLDGIMNHRHDGCGVWRLIGALTALGDVGIHVLPDSGHERGVVLSETIGTDPKQAVRELAQMDEVDYQPEPRL